MIFCGLKEETKENPNVNLETTKTTENPPKIIETDIEGSH